MINAVIRMSTYRKRLHVLLPTFGLLVVWSSHVFSVWVRCGSESSLSDTLRGRMMLTRRGPSYTPGISEEELESRAAARPVHARFEIFQGNLSINEYFAFSRYVSDELNNG